MTRLAIAIFIVFFGIALIAIGAMRLVDAFPPTLLNWGEPPPPGPAVAVIGIGACLFGAGIILIPDREHRRG